MNSNLKDTNALKHKPRFICAPCGFSTDDMKEMKKHLDLSMGNIVHDEI